MKNIIIPFFFLSVLLLVIIILSTAGPGNSDKLILLSAPFRGDVIFPHDEHAFGENIGCMECHHTLRDTGLIISCSECHNNLSPAGSSLKIYHRLCIGCHSAEGNSKKAPQRCDDCHQKP